MEYMVVVLAVGFVVGGICLVITRSDLNELQKRYNSHCRSRASHAHEYEPIDFEKAYITVTAWCELQAKLDSKMDKPLFRRSTDKPTCPIAGGHVTCNPGCLCSPPNRRKGGKK